MQSEMIELNGHPFHLCRWGDPDLPVLLMLHGFPEYCGAWSDLAPLLADRFHCIAPDQRGYGLSWTPDGVENYRAPALIGDMAALIDHIGPPVTVLGHDWGAAIAYGLAIHHPQRIRRLIIANGVHSGPFQRALAAGGAQSAASQYMHFLRRPDAADILAKDDYAKLMAVFSANMDTSWLTPDRFAEYRSAWSRPGRMQGMVNWYAASPMRIADPGQPITDLPDPDPGRLRVSCPHLLIWGEADTALLPESTHGLEEFAPRLTRHNIPGADHWLCHTHAEEVAQAIADWTDARH